MTEKIEPFVRVDDDVHTPGSSKAGCAPLLIWLMRAHLGLARGVLFLAMLILAGSLYGEFDNVAITNQLGLRFVRDIYDPENQKKLLLLLVLAAGSLLFFHASQSIGARTRGTVVWSRVAAFALFAGIPLGIMIWRAAGRIDEVDSTVAEVLADFPWILYVLSVMLIGQAVVAVGYQIGLSRSSVRRALLASARGVPLGARMSRAAVVIWLEGLLAAGVVLGVLTDWLYEFPVADAEMGEILYATSFDGYADDWDIFQGRDGAEIRSVDGLDLLTENHDYPAVSGNVLMMTYGAPVAGGIVWSALDRGYRDFDLRVTVQQVNGAYDQNQYGILFRYRDEKNFYIFRITSDGWYKLAKVSGGIEEVISDWGETAAIRISQAGTGGPEVWRHRANVIRIVALGDEFRFWVNGEALPLCLRGTNTVSMWSGPGTCLTSEAIGSYTDDNHNQGQIALAVGSLDGSSVTVAFDDLVISGPLVDDLQP